MAAEFCQKANWVEIHRFVLVQKQQYSSMAIKKLWRPLLQKSQAKIDIFASLCSFVASPRTH